METDGSAQFLEQSRFWIQRVFVPILVFIGVGGNVVTVMILTRRRMRCTTNIYLTALAIADLIYLLFVLLLSFEHYPNIHNKKYELYWRFYGITHWICDAASSTSVWLIVSFTIERYIIVCHPLRGKVYCTEGRAKNIITLVCILCMISTASTTFEYQLTVKEHCVQEICDNAPHSHHHHATPITLNETQSKSMQDPEEPRSKRDSEDYYFDVYPGKQALSESKTEREKRSKLECTESESVEIEENITLELCDGNKCTKNETCCKKSYTIFTEPTELGKNETYTTIFYWFSSITYGLLPFVLIASFNCFLIKAVFESTRMRKGMMTAAESSKQRNENRITILLIGIIILFLICQTPTAFFLIYDALDDANMDSNIKRALGNIFNLLINLNASCNFLMYCVLSDNYRRTFKLFFCSRNLNREDTSVTTYALSRSSRYNNAANNGFRRNISEYRTPRNVETQSLNSVPRSKSLMTRPIGKAKSTDLNV